MITAQMMRDMFNSFDEAGMDLSVMEVRVVHKAEDINDDIDEPLTGYAEISVEDDGTHGTFTFHF